LSELRPAFYALAPGRWRDYLTLLHVPYTLWHLSYVAIGAALAPHFDRPLLGWTLLAFALALGVGAHALDELQGRPLQTRIPARTLVALAVASVGAAAAIGAVIAVERDLWLLAFVVVGCFLVVAYNVELFGGRLHGDIWFGVAWGAFPLVTAYFASAHTIRVEALAAAAAATLLSLAQRVLSTPVRDVRRRVASVAGKVEWRDGRTTPLDTDALKAAPERALQLLASGVVLLAVTAVVARVT
jgi:hypothetical protein